MIIDKIAEQVFKKAHEISGRQSAFVEPKIAVFVSHDMYCDMCREIHGKVSQVAMDFIQDKKIYGHPVYRVIDGFNHFKVFEI